jgi:hypothetical protein
MSMGTGHLACHGWHGLGGMIWAALITLMAWFGWHDLDGMVWVALITLMAWSGYLNGMVWVA